MKKYLLISFAALMTIAGCSKDDVPGDDKTPENPPVEGDFIASQSVISATSSATKTTLDGTSILWKADDAITLFAEDGTPVKYVLTDGENSTSGSFTADTDALPAHTSGYALYPATKKSLTDDSTVPVTIATSQTYSTGGFPAEYPMAAVSSDGKNYSFDNLAVIVNIPLQGAGITVSSIILEALNGEKIAGESAVRFNGSRTPSLSASDNAAGSVTLNCGTDGVALTTENTVFSFIVIPDVYSGFRITVKQTGGPDIVRTSSEGIALRAGTVASLPSVQMTGWKISGTAIGENSAQFSGSTRFISLKGQTVTDGTFTISDPDGSEYSCAQAITLNSFNQLQAGGNSSVTLTAGTYDLYIDTANKYLFVMEEGKGPFVVQGEAEEWGSSGPLTEANMTLGENGLFVAENVQFKSAAKFKITASRNGGYPWSALYEILAIDWYPDGMELNTAINVKDKSDDKGNGFAVSGNLGPFDIWFDPDNMLVWIMSPGQKPNN